MACPHLDPVANSTLQSFLGTSVDHGDGKVARAVDVSGGLVPLTVGKSGLEATYLKWAQVHRYCRSE